MAANGPWNRAAVLLVCWVITQVMPPPSSSVNSTCGGRSRPGFDDPASRTVRASLIVGARARRLLQGSDGTNGTLQGAVFDVERVLKGVHPSAIRSIVVYFSAEDLGTGSSGFEECLRRIVRPGSRYLVFIDDAQLSRGGHVALSRHRWPTVKASGLPRIATERLVRIVMNYSCSGCGRPPRAEVWPQIVDLTTGKSLELECRVTGRPKPKVTWFKDGVVIPRGGRIRLKNIRSGSRLRIRRVGRMDSGLFQCQASNVLGASNAPRSKITIRRNKHRRPHSRVCEEHTYCLNGGICHRLKSLNITYCQCNGGYEGERCQQKEIGLNALNRQLQPLL